MPPSSTKADFVVVEPNRTSCAYFSRALYRTGRLRLHCIGTRRGISGVGGEVTRLKPAFGLTTFTAAKVLSNFRAESFRFRLHPWIDRWALKMLQPGDNVLSSYGYANDCFKFARAHGGKTFLDAGNSHPDNFWMIMSEELHRWKSPFTPVARHHYERSLAMLEHVDYVMSPSSFVAKSFLERGFEPEQILMGRYPVDLSLFHPRTAPRAKDAPLTVISTGRLSLRKGTPYMLEAFRLIHKRHPSARFLLTQDMESNIAPILAKYSDLPIEWSPGLPHQQLGERLRSADVFVLLSLEEGLVRTALEAMACGVQVVLTPNTGASDLVTLGENGEVVPIRDASAAAEAVSKCHQRILDGVITNPLPICAEVSPESFERCFLRHVNVISPVNHIFNLRKS